VPSASSLGIVKKYFFTYDDEPSHLLKIFINVYQMWDPVMLKDINTSGGSLRSAGLHAYHHRHFVPSAKNLGQRRIAFTMVVVVNIDTRMVGMVVDGASDVITLRPEQLRSVPEFSSTIGCEHLLAIGSRQDCMLILIDIKKLMSSADLGLVSSRVH
jgi:hypothetical protein